MADADPNDTRFQFKVIENLAESVRQMATNMADMQRTQVDMLIRLARLEENKFGEDMASVKAEVKIIDGRVDALFRDKDRRDGATGAFQWLLKWGPTLFGLFTVLFLLGRALGVLHLPDQPVVEAKRPIVSRSSG